MMRGLDARCLGLGSGFEAHSHLSENNFEIYLDKVYYTGIHLMHVSQLIVWLMVQKPL